MEPVQTEAPAVPGAIAATSGLAAGPAIASLPITDDAAARALAAFRTSCAAVSRRSDGSGLTRPADWQPVCAAARTTAAGDARAFFQRWFETVQVGDGPAFATGYYEPEIAGSRERRPGYEVPIYGRPRDLVEADLGLFSDALKGKRIRGRVEGNRFVPYPDRTAIEGGAIEPAAPIIAWAANPVALFVLQIQGSGLLRLPDGSALQLGFDSQNGREYTGIGAWMKARGLLQPGHATMHDIEAYLHAHPDEGRQIMQVNKSYVFFRVMDGPPQGTLGTPVIGRATVAADPLFVPLGAPVFLSMDRADATGLWVAQDTGGAIKGANRFDTFWGAGAEAEAIAGGMSAHGTAFVLVPAGTLARLQPGGPGGGAAAQP